MCNRVTAQRKLTAVLQRHKLKQKKRKECAMATSERLLFPNQGPTFRSFLGFCSFLSMSVQSQGAGRSSALTCPYGPHTHPQ